MTVDGVLFPNVCICKSVLYYQKDLKLAFIEVQDAQLDNFHPRQEEVSFVENVTNCRRHFTLYLLCLSL